MGKDANISLTKDTQDLLNGMMHIFIDDIAKQASLLLQTTERMTLTETLLINAITNAYGEKYAATEDISRSLIPVKRMRRILQNKYLFPQISASVPRLLSDIIESWMINLIHSANEFTKEDNRVRVTQNDVINAICNKKSDQIDREIYIGPIIKHAIYS